MYSIQNGSNPIQPVLTSSAVAPPTSLNESPPEIVDQADKEEIGQVPGNIAALRQAHPWLNPSQLGNLMLNQSGKTATYHQVQALRPSYQTGHFDRLGAT